MAEIAVPRARSQGIVRVKDLRDFLSVFAQRKVAVFGAAIILLLVAVAVFAGPIAPYDPYKQNLRAALQPPSHVHLLGTDPLGRDVFSRIIYGTRTSLAVGLISVGLGSLIGMSLGMLAGYRGGVVDALIMRFVDAMMSIPSLMLALAVGVALGGGLSNVIIALGFALIPVYTRLMRGQVMVVKEEEYILAAKALGASHGRIMLRHIFPNTLPPLIVLVTLNLGVAILAEAGLSFLGLGIAPPGAAWGAMVSDGYRYLGTNPVLSLAPGTCIILVVLAVNFFGDGIRDALDPRLRRRHR
jgi:ABC-type dipeptide/oligopeptide/nickel transport system permease subunit